MVDLRRRASGLRTVRDRLLAIFYTSFLYRYVFLPNPFKIFEFREIVRGVPISSDDRLLDIGCGGGRQMMLLRPHCGSITGVDVSEEAVEGARRRFRRLSSPDGVELLCGGLEEFGFADGTFDKVFSFWVLQTVDDPQRFVREIRRVLREDGVAILSAGSMGTIRDEEIKRLHCLRYGIRRNVRRNELIAWLRDAGFRSVDVFPILCSRYAQRTFFRLREKDLRLGYAESLWRYARLRWHESRCRHEEGILLVARCVKFNPPGRSCIRSGGGCGRDTPRADGRNALMFQRWRSLERRDIRALCGYLLGLSVLSATAWWLLGAACLIVVIPLVATSVLVAVWYSHRRLQATLRGLHEDHRQMERLVTLLPLLDLRHPLPTFRDWAISPDFAALLIALVDRREVDVVLDVGAGLSTLIVGYRMKKIGRGRVVALEHDEDFARAMTEQIAAHGLSEVARVVVAPLRPVDVRGKSWSWYDPEAMRDLPRFDLLIVDGPPGNVQSLARYPALPLLLDRWSRRAPILLHDTDRSDERRILELWTAEFPDLSARDLDLEYGAAIIEQKPDGRDAPAPRPTPLDF